MIKYLGLAAFITTIPAANWLIGNVGECIQNGPCIVPVGFGLVAPSGVLMIGAALVLRDYVHEVFGWKVAALAVAVGAGLSFLTSSPAIALASAVAFGFSEMADMAVYSRLRQKTKPAAVLVSQVVGAILDSMLFAVIAFGSLELSAGLVLAKMYAGLAVFLFLKARAALSREGGE